MVIEVHVSTRGQSCYNKKRWHGNTAGNELLIHFSFGSSEWQEKTNIFLIVNERIQQKKSKQGRQGFKFAMRAAISLNDENPRSKIMGAAKIKTGTFATVFIKRNRNNVAVDIGCKDY